MNILTFDIEEWFHLLDNDSTRSEEQWKGFEVRIYENMERIFRILEETDTKATFFVIGWIAVSGPAAGTPSVMIMRAMFGVRGNALFGIAAGANCSTHA